MNNDRHLANPDQAKIRKKRSMWEERYHEKEVGTSRWYVDQPPEELVQSLASHELTSGPALDIGCGPGIATWYLASQNFRPVLGADFAFSAVRQARSLVQKAKTRPEFLVASAPFLPFGDQRFALVFDRGCMQAIPPTSRRLYAERLVGILKVGGTLQISANGRKLPKAEVEELFRPFANLKQLALEKSMYHSASEGRSWDRTYAIFRKESI
ncbi:class I SAM-dependent methyltransferase [bacterium]|nr:class I SAM-dependent methyltransferase [bacterium]